MEPTESIDFTWDYSNGTPANLNNTNPAKYDAAALQHIFESLEKSVEETRKISQEQHAEILHNYESLKKNVEDAQKISQEQYAEILRNFECLKKNGEDAQKISQQEILRNFESLKKEAENTRKMSQEQYGEILAAVRAGHSGTVSCLKKKIPQLTRHRSLDLFQRI